MPHIEPILSGYVPPGFDASTCCSVYVGNVHPDVTDALLAEVFQTMGPLKSCKLIIKEKASFAFLEYVDHQSAADAIMTLNGREIFNQCIKVNWAYANTQKEGTSGHVSIFVGDLSSEVTDATLRNAFSVYPSCFDARVVWDQRTRRSRGFGFVFFKDQQEADRAINEMSGKWIGSRVIRCNRATRNASAETSHGTNGSGGVSVDLHQASQSLLQDAAEKNPLITSVYVGNLAPEVNQVELYQLFQILGAGIIEDVRVQRDKGFGFVRYRTHEEAALAIQLANGKIIYGKPIKCSWGSKQTAVATLSTSQQSGLTGSYQEVVGSFASQQPSAAGSYLDVGASFASQQPVAAGSYPDVLASFASPQPGPAVSYSHLPGSFVSQQPAPAGAFQDSMSSAQASYQMLAATFTSQQPVPAGSYQALPASYTSQQATSSGLYLGAASFTSHQPVTVGSYQSLTTSFDSQQPASAGLYQGSSSSYTFQQPTLAGLYQGSVATGRLQGYAQLPQHGIATHHPASSQLGGTWAGYNSYQA